MPYDVVAICKAYTDFVVPLPKNYCDQWNILPDRSHKWPLADILHLIENFRDKGQYFLGGPSANSLSMLSFLGGKTGFIAKIANDPIGQLYINDLKARNIVYQTPLSERADHSSALCFIAAHDDGERTIIYNKGVSDELSLSDIEQNKTLLSQAKIIIASDFLREKSSHNIRDQILRLISPNAILASSLQSFNIIKHSKEVHRIINHANIIFGNEAEFNALLKELNQSKLSLLGKQYPSIIFVRTLGKKGAEVVHNTDHFFQLAKQIDVVDGIGAGDGFMGGFLFGLYQNFSLAECLAQGIKSATMILSVSGARLSTL